MAFIRENMRKLEEAEEEHMPMGFEVTFPSLIVLARGLGICTHLPCLDDSQLLQHIYAKRRIKLDRIPKKVMHRKATALLYSLEGFTGLNWELLTKLQSKDGSFLFSPSSTAYALSQTNDLNCLSYLQTTTRRFNGGVPNVYPVDLFEQIWVVDRLHRLGINRFFDAEINACMDYVYGYWTEFGICWARNSEVQDIDDTSMGFRLLRLHGYNVSADVLRHFKKDGEFFCFVGQSSQAVTGMFSLYKASQLQFPGETILEEAREYSSNYLTQRRASNRLIDKWIIQKDLPGEVAYALDLPWYANLPRIESRFYIDQYSGEDEVWIGKTLYRMPNISNNVYHELAKLDYNACQSIHLLEWDTITRWYTDYKVNELGLGQRELLQLYFVAAASIFEPERSNERMAWAKTWAMATSIAAFFRSSSSSYQERQAFALEFLNSNNCDFSDINGSSESGGQGLVRLLQKTLHCLSLDVLEVHGVEIHGHLRRAWEKWMVKWAEEGDQYKGVAEIVARTIYACSSPKSYPQHLEAEDLLLATADKICHKLGHLILQNDEHINPNIYEVNSDMQLLVERVLNSDDSTSIDPGCMKRIVLEVARGFYYSAYCSPDIIDSHLSKVLFQTVE